ncbi:hypothetical protein ACFOLF_28980 [Paenibacillus sepulcri]|uniref:Uncharacterized protein n=1 Tax=Paenibacillus sepulcri TaxID=359917 RepID=A0ABS7CAL6_9BACL|nr:hypothetical protein [Paenibacillus sepulcri]
MNIRFLLIAIALFMSGCSAENRSAGDQSSGTEQAAALQPDKSVDGSVPAASFTQGSAAAAGNRLFPECRGGRVTALGEIKSDDGEAWMVPSEPDLSLNDAGDLVNPCTNVEHRSISDINPDDTPLVVIDPDGVEITGYIFADNYFELYVNGQAVAKDAVVYTPFNSSIVRFKAKYPMTYAIKAVDWEENLGLGTEDNRGNPYYYGDAGIIAVFSDGTVTDESWTAQNYYVSPLMSKDDMVVGESDGKQRRTSPDYKEPPACNENCYAAHFAVPADWYAVDFDDTSWPQVSTYSEKEAGVDNKNPYTNFREEFSKGKFIWTGNLKLDNEILLRHTVEQ